MVERQEGQALVPAPRCEGGVLGPALGGGTGLQRGGVIYLHL